MLGIEIDSMSLESLFDEMFSFEDKAIIANVNIHAMNIAYTDKKFRDFLQQSALTFCDGAGVILASKMLGDIIVERITYADFMWDLARVASEKNMTMYFLGASQGTALRAKENLQKKYPALKVLGTHHGYFKKEKESAENRRVIDEINAAATDILVVGMGMPLQEYWILENFDELDVKIVFNGGAVFDYVSGELERAPRWMIDHGFEWLGRLLIEPRRLWKRYVLGIPLFFWRIFVHHFLKVSLPYQNA